MIDPAHQDAHHHEVHHQPQHAPLPHYLIPFSLIFLFAIVEAVGAWYTGSLALLSDAGHMFSDVLALGLAWLAAVLAKKPGVSRHASGVSYVELAVAVINALTMLAVIVLVVAEAWSRFIAPHPVEGLGLTIIASLGLLVNLIVAKQLHQQSLHHGASLNNRAAFLHVLGDLLGSIAAVIAGLVVYFTAWTPIDPILSLFISLLLMLFTFNLMRDIAHTLLSKQSGASVLAHHGHDH
jgi:cobalt-zinc-cadmium efflux system protein